MQFLGKPKALLPFMNTKDCSLRLCSTYCPKWCDGIFQLPSVPPPPFAFPDDDKSQTRPTFSPLVIAIIGILASAFLLVSYYAIISKYCGNSDSSSRRNSREVQPSNNEEIVEDDYDGSIHQHEPWLITTPGLDEALIKTITLVKYKKGDGLITSSDCSVCLGEFLEDDTLRLLPKCSHAFHVACIDTWLRSHSNCPLCRANIISTLAQPPPNPSLVVVDDNNNNNNNIVQDHNALLENQVQSEEISSSEEGRHMGLVERAQVSGNLQKTPLRALSDIGVRGHGGEDTMRRSISMDHRYETRVSISDVFRYDHGEEDCVMKICQYHDQSLKRAAGESSKSDSDLCNSSISSGRNGMLHCVMSSVTMKRSFSSGRFLLSKQGRGRNAVIPL